MPLDTQYRKDIVLIYILIYLHPPAVGVLPPYTQQFLSVMEAIHSYPVRLTFSVLVSQDTSCCQSSNKKNPRGFFCWHLPKCRIITPDISLGWGRPASVIWPHPARVFSKSLSKKCLWFSACKEKHCLFSQAQLNLFSIISLLKKKIVLHKAVLDVAELLLETQKLEQLIFISILVSYALWVIVMIPCCLLYCA